MKSSQKLTLITTTEQVKWMNLFCLIELTPEIILITTTELLHSNKPTTGKWISGSNNLKIDRMNQQKGKPYIVKWIIVTYNHM